jgi:hypothetical protein
MLPSFRLILPCILSLHVGWAVASDVFQFALLGDMPYRLEPGEHSVDFDYLVQAINKDWDIKWVLHAGDIKSSRSPCSDAMLLDRYQRFNQFNKPFILTPGDNEWTDCHRVSAGEFQPRERLDKLRQVFWHDPAHSLGRKPMAVTSQSSISGFESFPENVYWVKDNLLFFTVHMVGSKNGLQSFDRNSYVQRSGKDVDEVKRRTRAAIYWVQHVFAYARSKNISGIFMLMHADPGIGRPVRRSSAYYSFISALEQAVRSYGKPVMLAHGDTHFYRLDRPTLASGIPLPNFTRVITPGGTSSLWLRITVDPSSIDIFHVQLEDTDSGE